MNTCEYSFDKSDYQPLYSSKSPRRNALGIQFGIVCALGKRLETAIFLETIELG